MNYRKLAVALALVFVGLVAGSPVAIQTGIGIGVQSATEAQNEKEAGLYPDPEER